MEFGLKAQKQKKMKKTVRVEIPKNPDLMLALANLVIAKHKELGVLSPLKSLNMAEMETKFIEANASNTKAKEYRRLAETTTEQRNRGIGIAPGQNSNTEGTLYFFLVAARDILLGLNRGKEHKLGELGFEVSTNPRKSSSEPEEPDKV